MQASPKSLGAAIMPYNTIMAKDINIPFVSDHSVYSSPTYVFGILITFKQGWLVSLFFAF